MADLFFIGQAVVNHVKLQVGGLLFAGIYVDNVLGNPISNAVVAVDNLEPPVMEVRYDNRGMLPRSSELHHFTRLSVPNSVPAVAPGVGVSVIVRTAGQRCRTARSPFKQLAREQFTFPAVSRDSTAITIVPVAWDIATPYTQYILLPFTGDPIILVPDLLINRV